ncbi:hypothetical protein FO440_18290 [Mucilaginibacter corticis]|uniref:Uncharacterized protein n=1 Tax=Mucilaginibacter corticis TaxID=2597670 RepID=A0A556MIK4_9SPHI|nr:hypothetical protein [Mucilaginibacter corticis]TSJ39689.1 hypothetical protein FO440_18290 [Mucilaginibacter corticis]
MSLTITIILFFTGAGIITVAFIRDWYNKKKWGWYKTLLLTGFVVLTGAGAYDLVHAYLELIAESAAVPENVVQTPPKADTPARHQPGYALLEMQQPLIARSTKGDSVTFSYALANNGNAAAFSIHSAITYGHYIRGKVYLEPKNTPLNQDTSLSLVPAAKNTRAEQTAITYKNFISRSSFVCINLDYADSSRANKQLIKIYSIRLKPLRLAELSPEESSAIQAALGTQQLALNK